MKLTLVLASWIASASLAAASGHVRLVSASGTQNFTEIAPAVAAAIDGDVILVGEGAYSAFAIPPTLSVSILAAPEGALVQVVGTILVKPTAQDTVVLAGLDVRHVPTLQVQSETALRVQFAAGAVRVQDCSFRGSSGDPWQGGWAAPGAVISSSSQVAFERCAFYGAAGYFYYLQGGDGAAGTWVGNSSRASFSDCQLFGGYGGYSEDQGGRGGAGLEGSGASEIHASGCTSTGGPGGNGTSGFLYWGGEGGAGILLAGNATARVLDCALVPGAGGQLNGAPGTPTSGTGFTFLSGSARRLTATRFTDDVSAIPVSVQGVPGDLALALIGNAAQYLPNAAFHGVLQVVYSGSRRVMLLGTIPASGVLAVSVPRAALPPSLVQERCFLQAYCVSSSGQIFLSGANVAVRFNRDAGPDCDGNGVQDYVDVAVAPVTDCNRNLFPDPCDIANGISQDLDGNGVPDECGFTWYVDDSAPAGGNGFQGSPFQNLQQGIAAAQAGDEVVVLDGTYTGSANRELSFAGRDIVLRSASGPASCVIDCQQAGRAFRFSGHETSAARVSGFTIRNGAAVDGGGIWLGSSHVTIADCAIEECTSTQRGGGLYASGTALLVAGCTFSGCAAGTDGGGAWTSGAGAGARFLGCTFAGNTAGRGGAVFGTSTTAGHCTFAGNSAAAAVGASGGAFSGASSVLENCLFAGNVSAGDGGAIALGSSGTVSDCTIVDNAATSSGGGLHLQSGLSSITCSNNVVFQNVAPTGAQIRAHTQSSGFIWIQYSDVEGGLAGVSVLGGGLQWALGNLASPPQFADADGPDNDPLTLGDNDYRLALTSPCLDAGSNALVAADAFDLDGDGNTSEPTPVDVEGAARFVEVPSAPNTGAGTPPLVDIGCYERP